MQTTAQQIDRNVTKPVKRHLPSNASEYAESFDVAAKRAVSVEEFRKMCHEEVSRLYGKL